MTFDRVSKVYQPRGSDATVGDPIRALDDVTLNIGRGQTLGIVGESGSGKTTLLRTALSLTKPTSGRVCYAGKNLQDMTPSKLREACRNIQFVQQDPYTSLDPRYRVRRTMAQPLAAFRIEHRRPPRASLPDLL